MTIRTILVYPEHRAELRHKSEPVNQINHQVRRLIRDLQDTLQASEDGIGLAAPQINFHKRVVIVSLGIEADGKWQAGTPEALINPQVVEMSDERKDFDGCLSFPGLYGKTIRPHRLRVVGWNEQGQPFDRIYEGFNAVVVHHEIDHLDGVLFIDRIESVNDLYTIRKNTRGELVVVPFSDNFRRNENPDCADTFLKQGLA
ncbi:MAG: peptide deformylase [Anaerolineaceae bacterium]|nr:peptide deformylase [Anaerolineaceae bacterium]